MPTKVCYIISHIDKALAFEWIASTLDKKIISLHFILLNPGDSILEQHLKSLQIPVKRIQYHSKKDLPLAVLKIFWYLIFNNIKVIHCHLFDACMAGLTAAWLARVPKRIYTRHYSTNHHDYYPKAVKYDIYINKLATDIIAISNKVRAVLEKFEQVPAYKIHVIHHGFALQDFAIVDNAKQDAMKLKYGIGNQQPVVGVISRYVELKGLQYIIPAFAAVKKKHPNAFLLLANCNGDYKSQVHQLLKEYVAKEDYVEIGFENDLPTLYSLMDIFIHVPINDTIEAFGQTYIEALASGVPSVFTLSGVASEFIQDKVNALVVDFKNSSQIENAINHILSDEKLKNQLILNGKNSVVEKFSLPLYVEKLTQLYV